MKYTIDDCDLLTKGYVTQEINLVVRMNSKNFSKMEKVLRKYAMDKIFGKIKKSKSGNHKTNKSGSKNHDLTDLEIIISDSIGTLQLLKL